MPKRTHIQDHDKIEVAEDVERIVQDKREHWRANRRKKHRRHRHYVKTMLRHMTEDLALDSEEE